MKLITRIQAEGFRSLASTVIEPVGRFTCFVGTNNCGKSNILRALSLFFTDQPEPRVPLNLLRDCYADPRSKKKKQISISVSFSLPSNFRFRKWLEDVDKKLGRDFTIRRRWTYYPPEPIAELARPGHGFKPLDSFTFGQFRDLINFRYIPNRIVPTQVLRDETASFQAAIGRRLRRKGFDAGALLTGLSEAAADILSEADWRMRLSTESIEKLEIFTPPEVAALAAFSGVRAVTATGARVPDYVLGAGTQAFLMFVLLKIIDTDYSRHFGWRQATVWAIEEPESSLHKDLEQRLAIMLGDWSHQDRLKMQVLTTTHSEIFVTTADEGFMVEVEQGVSSARHKKIPELVQRAAVMGISGTLEPVLCFPMNPVVLVEGKLDSWILTHVAQQTGAAPGCKFVSLPELDQTQTGAGAEQMIGYLRRYGRLAQNRAIDAPLVVLFDWEVDDQKLKKAREYYGANSDFRVLRMSASHADPKISPEIHGIERFYPVELFQAAREQDIVDVAIDKKGNISIDREKLRVAKSALADMLCVASDDGWYRHLRKVLDDVKNASSILPGDQIKLNL